MSDCQHDCKKPAVFPVTVSNRPALPAIAYRIGTYSVMREHMLDRLNKDTTLAAWTHRGADDPGIAMLESAAIVGDILTFYQNLYANEAYIRTAAWRDSVAELVQLSGYRLAPGVGGEAVFALKVKGDSAVTVPKGFGFKAQLEGRDAQDEFESTGEITAYPHLSEFNLYRPADGMAAIGGGINQLELHAVDGAQNLGALQAVEIKAGDRMMLIGDSSMFDDDGIVYTAQTRSEILVVADVETVLNRIIVTFEGSLTVDRGSTVRAYLIDRSFRHFGYNASRRLTKYDGVSVTIDDTEFVRKVNGADGGSDYYSTLEMTEMPLDQEVDDLAAGGKLICQGFGAFTDAAATPSHAYSNVAFTVVREIDEVFVNSLQWANVEGATTVVKLKNRLITNDSIYYEETDIRRTVFHEAISPELTLRAPTGFSDGDFSDGELAFFGTYEEAAALAGRDLLLVDIENRIVQSVAVSSDIDDFEAQLGARDDSDTWLWTVSLDQLPQFAREDFDQLAPAITVYGNPVPCNQGKTQDQAVLGSGDNRQTFQTFALPKTPLTYLLDDTQTPAQVPELQVYVDNILWERVDTFFNSGPADQVYVVRQDDEENSYVQFGDGINGSKLSSGKGNVVAVYRTGIGAAGMLESDKKPSATGKLQALEKVFLPGEVVGGDDAESADNARLAAPVRMQSLDRLVGLADFEAETQALPGVMKVRADWAAPDGVPLVRIVVLTESGTSAAVDNVRNTLMTYNRSRGPARFPIDVVQGNLQYCYLKVRVGYAADRRQSDMETAVKLALGISGEEGDGIETDEGLFSLQQRRFGQGMHRSQILAAIQQVDGVNWVEIDAAQALPLGDPVETDPSVLPVPTVITGGKTIACLPTRILALYTAQLDLGLAMDETGTEWQS